MQKEAQSISEKEEKIILLLSSNPCLTLKEIARLVRVDRHRIQQAIREQYSFGFKRLNNYSGKSCLCDFRRGAFPI